MIVEWWGSIGTGLLAWLGTLFTPFALPSWLLDSTSGFYSFMNSASGLGVWLPMQALSIVVGFGVLCFTAMFGTKLILFIISKVPFIGGGG